MRTLIRFIAVTAVLYCASAQEEQRPVYHLSPESGHWINDPNGPFYDPVFNMYHLFAQYNPAAAVWGNMSWVHWQSADLVKWQLLPVAIFNDQTYDIGGAFSGSIQTVADNTPLMLYTCVDANGEERQCYATPSDAQEPSRTKWTKSSTNPFLDYTSLPAGYVPYNFRDPAIWPKSDDSGYWVAMAAELSGVGTVALYDCTFSAATQDTLKSQDITSKCSYKSSLWRSDWPTSAYKTYMVECPDFYAVEEGDAPLYALKYSIMEERRELYELGHYDEEKGVFTRSADSINGAGVALAEGQLEYDLGPNNHFYASKSFVAAQDHQSSQQKSIGTKEKPPGSSQRVLWGWLPENDDSGDRTWSGAMSLPRLVTYNALLGTLTFPPLPGLSSLRIAGTHTHFQMNNAILNHADSKSSGVYVVPIRSATLASEVTVLFHLDLPLTVSSGDCMLEVGLLGRTEEGGVYGEIATSLPWTYVKHGVGLKYKAGKGGQLEDGQMSLYSIVDTTHTDGNPHQDRVIKMIPGNVSAYINANSKHSSDSIGFDVHITMYYDHSVTEMYIEDGVGVATTRVYTSNAYTGLSVYAQTCDNAHESVVVHALDAWGMGSIWK
eukprot:gene27812-33587_t